MRKQSRKTRPASDTAAPTADADLDSVRGGTGVAVHYAGFTGGVRVATGDVSENRGSEALVAQKPG